MTMYPKDPVESRYERDIYFRGLVNTIETLLADHQFSPSELREACLLAATRYEMRTSRRSFVLSDGQVADFLERTDRDEKGEGRAADVAMAKLLRDHPELIRMTEEQRR